MRLIGMKLKGVGPYKDEFSIDFAALSRSHMFLIEGETGAGKTTILDGITFALYGSPSVLNADKTRMRSRFLGESREVTVVDLIVELNGVFYRIRREPEYQYVTKSGKTSTHRATAKLWKIEDGLRPLTATPEPDGGAARYFAFAEGDGHATSLAIKSNDVAAEINQLIGLNRDQFSKTIMLAQGQFSEFLRMKPEDRTNLVKELFSAQEYEHIQEMLKAMCDKQRHTVEDACRTLSEAIRQSRRNAETIREVHITPDDSIETPHDATDEGTLEHGAETALGEPFLWGLNDAGNIDFPSHTAEEILDRIELTMDAVAAESAHLQDDTAAQVEAKELELRYAEQRHRLSAVLVQHAQNERALVQEHIKLDGRNESIASEREYIERAYKAEPVLAKQRDLEQHERERKAVAADLTDILEQLKTYPTAGELNEQRDAALKAAAGKEAAEQKLAVVESHQTLLTKAESALHAMEEARAVYNRQRDETTRAQEAVSQLPSDDEIIRQITAYTERLAQRQLLQDQRKQAEQRLTHAKNVSELERRVVEQNAEVSKLTLACEQAEHEAEQNRQTFAMLDAAKYAGMLEEGQPCPVCGSTAHPNPYQVPEDTLDERAVKSSEKRAKQCAEDLHRAQTELERIKTQLKVERDAAQGNGVEEAQHAIDHADEALARLNRIAEQQDEAERQRDEIRKAQDKLAEANTELVKRKSALHAAEQTLESAQAEACGYTQESIVEERREAQQQLDEAREQTKEAERLGRRIENRQRLATRQAELESQNATLGTQIASLNAEVTALLDSQGFDDIEQAKHCALAESAIARKQKLIDDYQRQVTVNHTRLQDARRALADSIVEYTAMAVNAMADENQKTSPDAISERDAVQCNGIPSPVPENGGEQPVAYTDDMEPTVWGMYIEAIDLKDLSVAYGIAQAERDGMLKRQNSSVDLEKERQRCAEELHSAAGSWKRTLEEYEPIYRMAQLANGGSDSPAERKLTLITYAVTERFRDVLMRANEILKDIQGGVYELRLGEHEGRGGTKTGLPIDIFDRRNEQLRPPSSLSGGETFFVSLALALALADIIQAENGGLSMETLFIDEGFGTLSDDYLDDVMGILRDIAKTRDVGIISHVGQLKDQIHERISVTRVHPDAESRLAVIV